MSASSSSPVPASAGSKRLRESGTEDIVPGGAPVMTCGTTTRMPWNLVAELSKRCSSDAGLSEDARAAAAAAGIPESTDAWLCHLGRAVNAALTELPATAESANERLRAVRAALHAGVDARCDVLEQTVSAAMADKTAALELQLCAIDGALDAVRDSRDAVAAEVGAWSGGGLGHGLGHGLGSDVMVARAAELSAQLDAAEARLAAIPACVVETPKIEASFKLEAALSDIASWGQILAPRAIPVADLKLELVSDKRSAWAGHPLWLRLHAPSLPPGDETYEALQVVAAMTRVDVRLQSRAIVPAHVRAFKHANNSSSYILIQIRVPADGGSLHWAVSVAGHPVTLPDVLRSPWIIELPYESKLSKADIKWLKSAIPPPEEAAESAQPHARALWREVYRATRDGFDATACLAKCGEKSRLLVLFEDKASGVKFGGFTTLGLPARAGERVLDSDAFLFFLDEKKRTTRGKTVYHEDGYPLCIGSLRICAEANAVKHTLAPRGLRAEALFMRAAEIVAWVV